MTEYSHYSPWYMRVRNSKMFECACGFWSPTHVFDQPNALLSDDKELNWDGLPACPECVASQAFQDDLIQFEIGFEGDRHVWLNYTRLPEMAKAWAKAHPHD